MNHLYELTGDFQNLYELIDTAGEEIPEEAILDTLESVQCEIKDKAVAVACVIKEADAVAKMIKAEEERLSERRKAMEKRRDWLKDYLSRNLQEVGLLKIDDAKASITFRASKAVEVVSESALIEWAKQNNDSILTYKEPTLNKTEIKKVIEAGREIPGASIVERKNIGIK